MDTADEASQYDLMDHSEVNRQFVDDLLSACPDFHDVLDVGAGTAQIPIELCRRVEMCRVMAADLSCEMLDLARYNIEVQGLIDRIQLDQADVKQMPYRDGMFDLVMSNGSIHHIAEPLCVFREALRVTADGGYLFFRDLLRPPTWRPLNAWLRHTPDRPTKRSSSCFANRFEPHSAWTSCGGRSSSWDWMLDRSRHQAIDTGRGRSRKLPRHRDAAVAVPWGRHTG